MDEARDDAKTTPDDVGPPESTSDKWLAAVGKTLIVAGLGGVAFFAITSTGLGRTRGAPASARLELERRRMVAERAIAEADKSSEKTDSRE